MARSESQKKADRKYQESKKGQPATTLRLSAKARRELEMLVAATGKTKTAIIQDALFYYSIKTAEEIKKTMTET